ncbi:MAG: potassium channel family protein [Armatimonadota bacterium]
MDKRQTSHKVSLVTGYEEIIPELLRRLLFVVILIFIMILILWADRDGLRDNAHPGRDITFLDVSYFTVVTLTTVGYGDIAPVTPGARLISTLIITPIRVIILITFIGTAYQLVLQRYREAYQMKKVKARLKNHIIICGYGVKGHATVTELISFGRDPQDIVVIDTDAEVTEDAARDGLVAFSGDATSEAALNSAAIDKASALIVNVDRDDTTVLICLTAKHLNPNICVAAAGREAENVPLIYRSGADVVVASPITGGRMLALATHMTHVPRFLDDILTFGRGLDFGERTVQPTEDQLMINELTGLGDKLVIGAYHAGEKYTFDKLSGLRLNPGDSIIYLAAKPDHADEK